MGFFGRIARAVGRKIGEAVEYVGEKVHSETIQDWGRNIQDACRETSRRTGETREYDRDTATESETEKVADILSDFSLGLKSQAQSLETKATSRVEQYFDVIITALQEVIGDTVAVRSLKLQKKMITQNIHGKLGEVLSRRVALTDNECLKILNMPKGQEKERAMNRFGQKVIREGLNSLADSVSQSLDAVNQAVTDELNDLSAQQKHALEAMSAKLQQMMNKNSGDTNARESGMLEPANTLSASELVIDLLKEN
nr:hypothetical protein [uncultured Agathobaculum sp.]